MALPHCYVNDKMSHSRGGVWRQKMRYYQFILTSPVLSHFWVVWVSDTDNRKKNSSLQWERSPHKFLHLFKEYFSILSTTTYIIRHLHLFLYFFVVGEYWYCSKPGNWVLFFWLFSLLFLYCQLPILNVRNSSFSFR